MQKARPPARWTSGSRSPAISSCAWAAAATWTSVAPTWIAARAAPNAPSAIMQARASSACSRPVRIMRCRSSKGRRVPEIGVGEGRLVETEGRPAVGGEGDVGHRGEAERALVADRCPPEPQGATGLDQQRVRRLVAVAEVIEGDRG